MYNRKFNIKNSNDYQKLVELEYDIEPIIRKIENEDERTVLTDFIRKTFNNQWKQ